MVDVSFFIQYSSMGSSSRGILSGGRILDFGDLCDERFMRSIMKGRYILMFQVGRNWLRDLKSMTLEEFESIFYPNGFLGKLDNMKYLLGFSDIDSPFRKEVLQKYGALANKEKVKTTTKYNVGDIFKGVDEKHYIYLGNIERMEYVVDNELKCNYSGHLYMPVNCKLTSLKKGDIYRWLKWAVRNYEMFKKHFLKTKKKAADIGFIHIKEYDGLEDVGSIKCILPRTYLYNYERNLKIEYKLKK